MGILNYIKVCKGMYQGRHIQCIFWLKYIWCFIKKLKKSGPGKSLLQGNQSRHINQTSVLLLYLLIPSVPFADQQILGSYCQCFSSGFNYYCSVSNCWTIEQMNEWMYDHESLVCSFSSNELLTMKPKWSLDSTSLMTELHHEFQFLGSACSSVRVWLQSSCPGPSLVTHVHVLF